MLGRCARKDKCRFSHQIPPSVRDNPSTLQWANAFIKPKYNPCSETSHKTTQRRTHIPPPSPYNMNMANTSALDSVNTTEVPHNEATLPYQSLQNNYSSSLGRCQQPAPVLFSTANTEPEKIAVPNITSQSNPVSHTKSHEVTLPYQSQQNYYYSPSLGQCHQQPAPVLAPAANTVPEKLVVPNITSQDSPVSYGESLNISPVSSQQQSQLAQAQWPQQMYQTSPVQPTYCQQPQSQDPFLYQMKHFIQSQYQQHQWQHNQLQTTA